MLEEIDKILVQKEFLFFNTKYDLVTEGNKINIIFNFEDLEKFYVEQINIFGNFITEEKVIRNSLIIDEGDAFNEMLFDKSLNAIRSRGFLIVKSDVRPSDKDTQKKL